MPDGVVADTLGFGQGEEIVMNTHYQVIAHVRAGNGLKADLHEFQIGPRDTAYVTAYNPILCDLRPAGGKIDGTAILTVTTMDTVKSQEQLAAEAQSAPAESSKQAPASVGGLIGRFAKRAAEFGSATPTARCPSATCRRAGRGRKCRTCA